MGFQFDTGGFGLSRQDGPLAGLATVATATDSRVEAIETDKLWSKNENTRELSEQADARGAGKVFPWRSARQLRAEATKLVKSAIAADKASRAPAGSVAQPAAPEAGGVDASADLLESAHAVDEGCHNEQAHCDLFRAI